MLCREGGEMILVADTTQDIYEVSHNWTDEAMIGAGFYGAWSQLKKSYRLPDVLVPHVREFAERYIPSKLRDLPESNDYGDFFFNLNWIQVSQDNLLAKAVEELKDGAENLETSPYADIVFLTEEKEIGLQITSRLGQLGIKVQHIFDKDASKNRASKIHFYMGRTTVKGSTIHSFKGWESNNLFIIINSQSINNKTAALIYTALTRSKHSENGTSITVISANPEFAEYGRTWNNSETSTL
jgi:hypothetical protein